MSRDLEQQLRERLQRASLPSAPLTLRESLESVVRTPVKRTVPLTRRRITGLLAVAAVLATGGILMLAVGNRPPVDTALDPNASPLASAPPASTAPSASPGPSAATSAATSAAPTSIAIPPPAASVVFPVVGSAGGAPGGSAREVGDRVLTAPGPDGSLFVWIPRPTGSVLALLDRSGQPHPGWPISVNRATWCSLLLPVDDGSVRLVCDNADLQMLASNVHVFAFDADGQPMAGWPVQLPRNAWTVGRMIRDELALFGGDWNAAGDSLDAWVTTIAADGSVRRGIVTPTVDRGVILELAIAPDGVAYAVASVGVFGGPGIEESQIAAFDQGGARPGWPLSFDGIPSGPAFGDGGRILMTVGSFVQKTSRVLAIDRDGEVVSTWSGELMIASTEFAAPCGGASYVGHQGPEMGARPQPPIIAPDGTVFVFSGADPAVYALDPSLAVRPGWPFHPATPPVRPYYPNPQYQEPCSSLGIPAVGPDSTLYLSLQAQNAGIGGSLVAIGPDGEVRPGWPVELLKPGTEFWSVVVGADGTVFALAVEPEDGDASSATVLAIDPDSTVLYTTTIIEP